MPLTVSLIRGKNGLNNSAQQCESGLNMLHLYRDVLTGYVGIKMMLIMILEDVYIMYLGQNIGYKEYE